MDDNNNQSLRDKWGNFLNIMLDPWIAILLVATLGFIYFSTKTEDKNLIAVTTLIISLMSGLVGGIIANRWAQKTELKVLVARGKSAIRSLKLILLNISNIEKRTKEYITSIDKENKDHRLIISNFEEMIEKCNILEEEIISSIENWTDIIPEVANLKTQIGLVSEMKTRYSELERDILNLNTKLTTVKEEGSKQEEELIKKLSDKEADLNKTQQKLREAENKINTTVLSGLTGSPLSIGVSSYSPSSWAVISPACKNCGKKLNNSAFNYSTLCSDCLKNST